MSQVAVKPKLVLPTVKSEVNKAWIDQKIGMIGAPGIGKSGFWAEGENTLFLQLEAGLNHLRVMKVPCRTWEEIREVYAALLAAQQAGTFPYDTIVIDTIDEFVKLADAEVLEIIRAKFKDRDINSIFDYPAASDKGNPAWGWRRDLVMQALKKFEDLPAATVFVGHLDFRDVKTPTQVIHKQTISIGGALGTDLVSWTDHFLNIESKDVGNNKVRNVRTVPTTTVDAKSRGAMIPDGWVWTASSAENYAKMRRLFS